MPILLTRRYSVSRCSTKFTCPITVYLWFSLCVCIVDNANAKEKYHSR